MTLQTSPVVHALPYPVLETGNLGFPGGSYNPVVKMNKDGCGVTIEHNVSGVPFIEKLIENGELGFYCLFSIPKSGVRELRRTERKGNFSWDLSIVGEPPKLRPMLIYTGDDRKHTFTETCGVHELWQGIQITLPKGARVARGEFLNVSSSELSFLRFQVAKDFKNGVFAVQQNTEDGFTFTIKASKNIFDFVQQHGMDDALRSGILTSAVARCFEILKQDYGENDRDSNRFPNLDILSAKLKQEYDCDWHDEDFDPMQAATTLYPFQVPTSSEDSEDEL